MTPSLVILAPEGPVDGDVAPLGPSVTLTALASMSMPRSILSRASNENLISLAAICFLPQPCSIEHRRMAASLGRVREVVPRQAEPIPHVDQRRGELIDHVVLVAGRGRDAQPLGSLRHGRIVDRLDIDAVLAQQQVARRLALRRIADQRRERCGCRSA